MKRFLGSPLQGVNKCSKVRAKRGPVKRGLSVCVCVPSRAGEEAL